jgi:hypothetical protein
MRNFLKSVFFVFIQAPLIGILALYWTEFKHRPFLAVLVGVTYECFAFLVSFGKKVYAELEKDAVAVSANWIRELVLSLAPGFQQRYKKQIVKHLDAFNVRGLGLINTSTLPLSRVFVQLSIDHSNPQKFNVDLVPSESSNESSDIWHFLRRFSIGKSEDENATAFVIVGPPGCGKTTLLQHVATTFALNQQNRHGIRIFTPILLFLRDHVMSITRDQTPLIDLVQDHFENRKLYPTLRPPNGWFRRRINNQRCMILLDGMDEVGDQNLRQAVCDWIDNQLKAYPRCTFLITSRPQSYRETPLTRARVMEVKAFNFTQVKEFIRNWYLATEFAASKGRNDETVSQRAETEATDLIQRIQSNPNLKELAVNPLLLTMITMVHRYCDALPDSRAELYSEICAVLLGRWRHGKGLKGGPKATQKLAVLCHLAAYMMDRRLRDVPLKEAFEVIAIPLRRIGALSSEAEGFLKSLEADSGLLIERRVGHWSFAHLTLQEYLTSVHWLEHPPGQRWSILIGDIWWEETLRLHASQIDATALVEQCLILDTVASLALAHDLLEEAREIESEVRHAAEDRLIVAIESTDALRRELAAKVLLARRLRQLQRIDENREIDLDYITCAEFQLFLDDTVSTDRSYQPDDWTTLRFPPGKGRTPVKGVRPQAALAFCEWLNSTQSSVHYRLPIPDEANQYPARTKGLMSWCLFEDQFRLAGIEESFELDVARTLKRSLGLSFERLSDIVFTKDQRREIELTLALGHALDLRRGYDTRSPTETNPLARKLACELAVFIQLNYDSTGAQVTLRERNSSIESSLARELALDIDLSRNLERFLKDNSDSVSLAHLMDTNELQRATDLSHRLLLNDSTRLLRRRLTLLNLLLGILMTRSAKEQQALRNKFGEQLLEFAYAGLNELWPKRDSASVYLAARLKDFLLSIRWWKQVSVLRKDGHLPSWESLRVVREKISDFG